MRLILKTTLAALGLTALATGAIAADRAIHVMHVALPDGSVEQIRYVGDHPPVVRLVPVRMMAMPMFQPTAFDRMFAAMDAQAGAMMQRAAMLANAAQQSGTMPDQASLAKLPAGTVQYSYVSTTSANGCTQTVRMTSDGGNHQPKVIRTSAGQCDSATMQPATAAGAKPAVRPAVVTNAGHEATPADTI